MTLVVGLGPDPNQLCPSLTQRLAALDAAYELGDRDAMFLSAASRRTITELARSLGEHGPGSVSYQLQKQLASHLHLLTSPTRSLCPCLAPSLQEPLEEWRSEFAPVLTLSESMRAGLRGRLEGDPQEVCEYVARFHNLPGTAMELETRFAPDIARVRVTHPSYPVRTFFLRRYELGGLGPATLNALPGRFVWQRFYALSRPAQAALIGLVDRLRARDPDALYSVLYRTEPAALASLDELGSLSPERLDTAAALAGSFHGDAAALLRLTASLQGE